MEKQKASHQEVGSTGETPNLVDVNLAHRPAVPWCWRTGPSTASERGHFQEMLQQQKFPENTLFCADAGFIGYELWKSIIDGGHHFLIRVGGNVHLLRKLGRVRVAKDIVYFWPRELQRQKQPPLMARLLSFQGARGPVHLLTSVLDPKQLSLTQARDLYKRRWGGANLGPG